MTPTMTTAPDPLANFGGTARLFPLPNLVFFPRAVQPLHIFDPRYRHITADALAGDRLIALVLPRPGWDQDYAGNFPLHPVACLGHIDADQRLPDGRYNLLLRGLTRVRLLGEVPDGKLYRTARAEVLADGPPPEPAEARRLRAALAEQVLPRFAAPAREQLRDLFQGELPLAALCDILAFALPLPVEQKQALLEQLDVGGRAERLLTLLDALGPVPPGDAADRKFPPDFSAN